ncbi:MULTISPECIES: ABC transporter substrate-binding protein [unclassified Streptomyces]|uniref:ABC transporter substrate-binding protein n=1 Tax=Streptomyces thermocoprophilus TaxID=78356 RepID=A0ABV5V8Z6_9ACTN
MSASSSPVRVGVLAPLSRPGWVEAGRHLLAGVELAAADVAAVGGVGGRPLELLVRDTAADPRRAEAALDELDSLGVAAVVGEYHSVVARAAAARADALRLPFLCASAVLDALTDEPTEWVARLSPPQSRGWRIYAHALLAAGHRQLAVAGQPGEYWASGVRVLRKALDPHGGTLAWFDADAHSPEDLCDRLAGQPATALLLLTGFPEPAVPIVRAVRRDVRLADVLVGAPAGQPEFAMWADALGGDGAGVPFLRHLPERLTPLGERVAAALRARRGGEPSFVAYEGYDALTVLADALRAHGTDRSRVAAAWPHVAVEGTRGTVRFSRVPGIGVWQWAGPPVQVVDRDPAAPGSFRVLRGKPQAE